MFGGSDVLEAAIDRGSPHLRVLPSARTLYRIERFAERMGIKYTFKPDIESPWTDRLSGLITFEGIPGQSTLADVPLIDIADEFSHAWGMSRNVEGATVRWGPRYYRFHQLAYGARI